MERRKSVQCYKCGRKNFTGARFKCLDCKEDFCPACYDKSEDLENHKSTHSVQPVLSRNELEIFYGGGVERSVQSYARQQPLTCPFCGERGFAHADFLDHIFEDYTKKCTKVLCPLCVCGMDDLSKDDRQYFSNDLICHFANDHHLMSASEELDVEDDDEEEDEDDDVEDNDYNGHDDDDDEDDDDDVVNNAKSRSVTRESANTGSDQGTTARDGYVVRKSKTFLNIEQDYDSLLVLGSSDGEDGETNSNAQRRTGATSDRPAASGKREGHAGITSSGRLHGELPPSIILGNGSRASGANEGARDSLSSGNRSGIVRKNAVRFSRGRGLRFRLTDAVPSGTTRSASQVDSHECLEPADEEPSRSSGFGRTKRSLLSHLVRGTAGSSRSSAGVTGGNSAGGSGSGRAAESSSQQFSDLLEDCLSSTLLAEPGLEDLIAHMLGRRQEPARSSFRPQNNSSSSFEEGSSRTQPHYHHQQHDSSSSSHLWRNFRRRGMIDRGGRGSGTLDDRIASEWNAVEKKRRLLVGMFGSGDESSRWPSELLDLQSADAEDYYAEDGGLGYEFVVDDDDDDYDEDEDMVDDDDDDFAEEEYNLGRTIRGEARRTAASWTKDEVAREQQKKETARERQSVAPVEDHFLLNRKFWMDEQARIQQQEQEPPEQSLQQDQRQQLQRSIFIQEIFLQAMNDMMTTTDAVEADDRSCDVIAPAVGSASSFDRSQSEDNVTKSTLLSSHPEKQKVLKIKNSNENVKSPEDQLRQKPAENHRKEASARQHLDLKGSEKNHQNKTRHPQPHWNKLRNQSLQQSYSSSDRQNTVSSRQDDHYQIKAISEAAGGVSAKDCPTDGTSTRIGREPAANGQAVSTNRTQEVEEIQKDSRLSADNSGVQALPGSAKAGHGSVPGTIALLPAAQNNFGARPKERTYQTASRGSINATTPSVPVHRGQVSAAGRRFSSGFASSSSKASSSSSSLLSHDATPTNRRKSSKNSSTVSSSSNLSDSSSLSRGQASPFGVNPRTSLKQSVGAGGGGGDVLVKHSLNPLNDTRPMRSETQTPVARPSGQGAAKPSIAMPTAGFNAAIAGKKIKPLVSTSTSAAALPPPNSSVNVSIRSGANLRIISQPPQQQHQRGGSRSTVSGTQQSQKLNRHSTSGGNPIATAVPFAVSADITAINSNTNGGTVPTVTTSTTTANNIVVSNGHGQNADGQRNAKPSNNAKNVKVIKTSFR